MSGKFEGFTQDDINKLSIKSGKKVKTAPNLHGIRRKPDPSNLAKENKQPAKKIVEIPQICETPETTDDSMTSLQEAVHFRPLSARRPMKEEASDESILQVDSDYKAKESGENAGGKAPSPFRGISLKDFERQRKVIQEQNKQKKEMLYKAIEHHSKKTAAETKKIEEIKAELAKLDNDLASDVALLRKQIDMACVQYNNIQKQYHKIESQFLKSKLELHNASEKKELLTEHLCTVITHNEDRKAKKLSELMEKVGINPDGQLAGN